MAALTTVSAQPVLVEPPIRQLLETALAELRKTGSYRTSIQPTTHAKLCEKALLGALTLLPA